MGRRLHAEHEDSPWQTHLGEPSASQSRWAHGAYLRNSRFEVDRASQLLTAAVGFPVLVKAALVFLTGSLIPNVTIKGMPDDVLVLDRMDIPGVFKRAPRRLPEDVVAAIFEVARRSTTWES